MNQGEQRLDDGAKNLAENSREERASLLHLGYGPGERQGAQSAAEGSEWGLERPSGVLVRASRKEPVKSPCRTILGVSAVSDSP